jgi:Holliday junction resolvasome RuvABC endonuclease subunit
VGSIVKQLDSIIKDQKVTTIYTEIPIGYQSARATEALSMAKAVVISITSLNNCMITAVDPFKIKKKITLDKNATKDAIYDEMIN